MAKEAKKAASASSKVVQTTSSKGVASSKGAKTVVKTFDVADQATNQAAADTMRSLILDACKAQNKANAAVGGISDKLLILAKAFQRSATLGTTDEKNGEQFLLSCKDQESFIKSKEARGRQVDKLPKCWTQAKSNIKAAMNYGIDLTKYNSESALRKAVIKMRSTKTVTPVDDALRAFKKRIEGLPTEEALSIMQQAQAAVEAALADLVPIEPLAPSVAA